LRRGCGAWGWKSTSRRFAITDAEVLPELTGEDLKDIGIAAAIAASCFKPSQHCARAPAPAFAQEPPREAPGSASLAQAERRQLTVLWNV